LTKPKVYDFERKKEEEEISKLPPFIHSADDLLIIREYKMNLKSYNSALSPITAKTISV
jgi:hypothetical protein